MNSRRQDYSRCTQNPFKCNYVAQVKMSYYGNKVTIANVRDLSQAPHPVTYE